MTERTTDLIPATERGEYTIADEQLVSVSDGDLRVFEVALLAEARRRGLKVSWWVDFPRNGVTVAWRPDPSREEPEHD